MMHHIRNTADHMRAHMIKHGYWINQSFAVIEKAYQMRVDEEGCGAFFAAITYPLVEFDR